MTRAVLGELASLGHEGELFSQADTRVSYFDYIIACSEPEGIGKALGQRLEEKLSSGGNLTGKRSMALLLKSGLRSHKALALLMAAMEKQGMVVTMGEIASADSEAAAAVHEAPIIRG
ncbi:MAG: hypothetical protein NT061_02030 [Spirochaetes bacterium]|nr:hypothetical protein [Spirochaetota bacterium]